MNLAKFAVQFVRQNLQYQRVKMLKEEIQNVLKDLELPSGFHFYDIEGKKVFDVRHSDSSKTEPSRYVDLSSGNLGLAAEVICYLINGNRAVGIVGSKKVLIYPITFNTYLDYSTDNIKSLISQAVRQLERPDKATS